MNKEQVQKPGDLDKAFNEGRAYNFASIIGRQGRLQDMHPTSDDGLLVVAAAWKNNVRDNIHVFKFKKDGTLDTDFQGTGQLRTSLSSPDGVYIQVDPNGNFYLSEMPRASSDTVEVHKFSATGAIDSNYGTEGVATIHYPSNLTYDKHNQAEHNPELSEDSLQVTGAPKPFMDGDHLYVIATGRENADAGNKVFVARLTPEGSLDTSFNSNGIVTIQAPFSPDTVAFAGALQSLPDQPPKLLVLAHSDRISDTEIKVVRLNRDGSIDGGFGNNELILDHGYYPFQTAIITDEDGKIKVSHLSANGGSTPRCFISGWTQNGQNDTDFGDNGRLTLGTELAGTTTGIVLRSFGRDTNYRFVHLRARFNSPNRVTVLRSDRAGGADPDFGTNGVATYADIAWLGAVQTMAAQPVNATRLYLRTALAVTRIVLQDT